MGTQFRRVVVCLAATGFGYIISMVSRFPSRPEQRISAAELVSQSPAAPPERPNVLVASRPAGSGSEQPAPGLKQSLISLLENSELQMNDSEFVCSLLNQLGRIDIDEALRLARSFQKKGISPAASVALMGYAENNPQGALSRASQFRVGKDSMELWQVAHFLSSKGKFTEIAAQASLEPHSTARNDLLMLLASTWPKADGAAFVAWMNTLPAAEPSRPAMLQTYISTLSQTDTDLAKDFALSEANPKDRAALVASVTAGMVKNGRLDQAAEWARTIKDDVAREAASAEIAMGLAEKSADEALEWMRRIENPERRDSTIQMMAFRMHPDNPAGQFRLFENMRSAVRADALARVAASWVRSNPAEAQQYIKGTTMLSNEERTRLLQIVK